ncbi:MAG: serine protein kinase RIO [Candidatus Bathyarchaeia archaeon]
MSRQRSQRAEDKLTRKEQRSERDQRMLTKDFSSERAVMEEVFDKSTLMVIYEFMNKGNIDEIHGVVKAGKESRVYWGKDKEGKELAIKIYLVVSREFRKGLLKYIEGDPRFQGVRHDTRSLIFAWAQKEFKNLELATRAKVRVPRPIAVKNNVLIMEFIGENGEGAPSFKEKTPKNPAKVYETLMTYLERLYRKAKLVHGDLSEYNIMSWRGRTVLFDVSQAVPLVHPMASYLLRRDLTNLNKYFSRLGVKVPSVEDSYRRVTGRGEG